MACTWAISRYVHYAKRLDDHLAVRKRSADVRQRVAKAYLWSLENCDLPPLDHFLHFCLKPKFGRGKSALAEIIGPVAASESCYYIYSRSPEKSTSLHHHPSAKRSARADGDVPRNSSHSNLDPFVDLEVTEADPEAASTECTTTLNDIVIEDGSPVLQESTPDAEQMPILDKPVSEDVVGPPTVTDSPADLDVLAIEQTQDVDTVTDVPVVGEQIPPETDEGATTTTTKKKRKRKKPQTDVITVYENDYLVVKRKDKLPSFVHTVYDKQEKLTYVASYGAVDAEGSPAIQFTREDIPLAEWNPDCPTPTDRYQAFLAAVDNIRKKTKLMFSRSQPEDVSTFERKFRRTYKIYPQQWEEGTCTYLPNYEVLLSQAEEHARAAVNTIL